VLDVVVRVLGIGRAHVSREERWQRGGRLCGVDHGDHDEHAAGEQAQSREEAVHGGHDAAHFLTGT